MLKEKQENHMGWYSYTQASHITLATWYDLRDRFKFPYLKTKQLPKEKSHWDRKIGFLFAKALNTISKLPKLNSTNSITHQLSQWEDPWGSS